MTSELPFGPAVDGAYSMIVALVTHRRDRIVKQKCRGRETANACCASAFGVISLSDGGPHGNSLTDVCRRPFQYFNAPRREYEFDTFGCQYLTPRSPSQRKLTSCRQKKPTKPFLTIDRQRSVSFEITGPSGTQLVPSKRAICI
jgi:hypothetical protein